MLRFIAFILKLGLLVGVIATLAAMPGKVSITADGTILEASLATAALCLFLLVAACLFLATLWRWIRHGPEGFRLRRALYRQRKGHETIAAGFAAIAAGDGRKARQWSRKAENLLPDDALMLLLKAQTAKLLGDAAGAEACYAALTEEPKTAALGYRGLIREALAAGNVTEADRLLLKANGPRVPQREQVAATALSHRSSGIFGWRRNAAEGGRSTAFPHTNFPAIHFPHTHFPWALRLQIERAAQRGEWADALACLQHAVRAKALKDDEAGHAEAAILIALARKALRDNSPETAMAKADRARKRGPRLYLAASLTLAEAEAQAGKRRTAIRTLRQAYQKSPHPDLIAGFTAIESGLPPLEFYRRMESFTGKHRRQNGEADAIHPESRIAMAQAALAADLWGEARRWLEPLLLEPLLEGDAQKSAQAATAPSGPSPFEMRGGAEAGSETARPTSFSQGPFTQTPFNPTPVSPTDRRVFALLTEIEAREYPQSPRVQAWQEKARTTRENFGWHCLSCQGGSRDFEPLCPHCGSFASLNPHEIS